jgi:hypothetical protein
MTRLYLREDPDAAEYEEWVASALGDDRDYLPADLGPILRGGFRPPETTILRRSDGMCLLYAGRLHWLSAEPEAGKTWLMLLAVAEVLRRGGQVVYFDYEMSAHDLVARLRSLGVPRPRIAAGLSYVRPPGKMSNPVLRFYGEGGDGEPALFAGADLVCFDACTEAMVADGLDPMDNTDVAAWLQRAPRLATRLGAAVVVADHVAKDREGRGRWAIGAQHKMAQADVSYSMWNVQPFRPGGTGLSSIQVTKDRPGAVRGFAAGGRRVGTLVLNAEDEGGRLEGFVAEPPAEDAGPTDRMAAILEFARGSAAPMTKKDLESVGGGRGSTSRGAVARLIADGCLVPAPGDEELRYPRYVAAEEEED